MPEITTSRVINFGMTEGPAFLSSVFIELEEKGTIAIGVQKPGDTYAFTRITKQDLLQAVAFLTGSLDQ